MRAHAHSFPVGTLFTVETDRYAAWRTLLQAQAAVLRAIERDLHSAGEIPLTWYDVLLELENAPEGCYRMQELAERVVLSRSRVSRLVDELQTAGLVERSPDPGDARAVHVGITDKGRAAMHRSAPHYLEAIERHFTAHLSETERCALVGVLGRVEAVHKKACDAAHAAQDAAVASSSTDR
jgi:DNA-binding MarR family transcriptional regulator